MQYTCEECDKEFARKFTLDRHMAKMHGEEEEEEEDAEMESSGEDEGGSDDESESDEGNDHWPAILTNVFARSISDEDKGQTATQILGSPGLVTQILQELHDEIEYIVAACETIDDSDIIKSVRKTMSKMKKEYDYTPSEASDAAWKARRKVLVNLLVDNVGVLKKFLEGGDDDDDDDNDT